MGLFDFRRNSIPRAYALRYRCVAPNGAWGEHASGIPLRWVPIKNSEIEPETAILEIPKDYLVILQWVRDYFL